VDQYQPSHEESCRGGYGVYLSPKSTDRYALIPYFKCTWACDAQAVYRIGLVTHQALHFHEDLSWDWLGAAGYSSMRDRSQYQQHGYMAFTVLDRAHKFVVASDQVVLSDPMPATELFRQCVPQLVDLGIIRLSKSQLWKPDTTGHTLLARTKNNNREEVVERIAAAGFVEGRILVDRPFEYHVEALQARLPDTVGYGPW
jgi:hypothetical protein